MAVCSLSQAVPESLESWRVESGKWLFVGAFPRGFLVLLQIIGRALVVLSPAPAFLHSGRFEVSYLLMEFQSHSGGSVKDPSLGIM
ncbi:hypothetical protein Bca4012_044416 [Brassica carinata]|uniref:Uncharacterized protein n=1 Tax=Brassica carinata TaxID=52824 RepID=A0A8X7QSU5_BRACI|nr:hypothetical protein Bca52824_058086 [Brassica carinata]